MGEQTLEKKSVIADSGIVISDMPGTTAANEYLQTKSKRPVAKPVTRIDFKKEPEGEIAGIPYKFFDISPEKALSDYKVGFHENKQGQFAFKIGNNSGVMTPETERVQVYMKEGLLVIETADKGKTGSGDSPNVSYVKVSNKGEVASIDSRKVINGVIVDFMNLTESDVKNYYGVSIYNNEQTNQLEYNLRGKKLPVEGTAKGIEISENRSGTQLTLKITNSDHSVSAYSFKKLR